MRRELKQTGSRTKKGLTLTEVVVASALLIIGVVPILKGLTGSHLTSAILEQKTQALVMAQAKMDEIKARSINNYSTNFGENNTPLGNSYICTVADIPDGPDIRTITVSVGYNDDGNSVLASDEIDVELSTKIAKRI